MAALRPRVETYPPFDKTHGDEAIELARRAGLTLDDWQCDALRIMLSVRDDGKWKCFEYAEICARQNGKTALLAARAIAGLYLLDERLIMWSSHEYKTSMESFLFVRGLVANLVTAGLVDQPKVSNTNGEEAISIIGENGQLLQRLKFLARSKGSGRGFSGDINLIDEAFAYTPTHAAALMPTMNARPNPQMVYMSSPPLDGETGEPLFRLRERGEAGGDPGLGWRDWGVGYDLDQVHRAEVPIDDRVLWKASNPGHPIRITMETLERNRRSMGPIEFSREILGVWPVDLTKGGGVIPLDLWDRLADPGSQIEGATVFAIDANPERSRGYIAAAGARPGDKIPHLEIVDQRRGVGWIVERAAELNKTHKPLAWVIDPGGPAGTLLPELHEAIPELEEGLLVVLEEVTGREFAQCCGAFLDAIHADDETGLRHLGDPIVTAAILAAVRKDLGDGLWRWHRKDSKSDISPLVALNLAHHGWALHGGQVYDLTKSFY